MLIVLGLALGRQVTSANRAGVELVSWYWHFVDGVWVVVFTVVYLVGTVSPEFASRVRERRMASDPQTIATARGPGRAGLRRDAPADRRAAGAGPGPGPAGRRRGPRARRFLVVGAVVLVAGLGIWIVQLLPGRGHVHEPLVEPARAPARDGRAGHRGASATGHARLPAAAAAGGSSHLRRAQGRHRRRPGDAAARPALGTAERPRPLVSGQPAGRHGPARRRQDDRSPSWSNFDPSLLAGGDRHSRRDVGGLRPDLRRAVADAAADPPAARLGRAADALRSGRG